MQVICTDGTMFTCKSYELTEYGVVLYDQPRDPEGERYERDPEQSGYVPHDRLWYILPEGITPNVPGLSALQGHPRGVSSQFDQRLPPGSQAPPDPPGQGR